MHSDIDAGYDRPYYCCFNRERPASMILLLEFSNYTSTIIRRFHSAIPWKNRILPVSLKRPQAPSRYMAFRPASIGRLRITPRPSLESRFRALFGQVSNSVLPHRGHLNGAAGLRGSRASSGSRTSARNTCWQRRQRAVIVFIGTSKTAL